MDQLVAAVNGSPIDDKALNAAMQSLAQEQFHATLDELPVESHEELSAMALERLIARELIFQAALAEGVVADDAAVEDESARILRMMGNPADFWKRLAERGMDEATFLRMVRKDVTVDQMSVRKCREIEEPTEAEIKDFFFAHPDQLRGQERVRASHIPIPSVQARRVVANWALSVVRMSTRPLLTRHSARSLMKSVNRSELPTVIT
jgi:peptidyl-prolyl cis-trans isomerase C